MFLVNYELDCSKTASNESPTEILKIQQYYLLQLMKVNVKILIKQAEVMCSAMQRLACICHAGS